MPMLTQLKMLT